jgi:hypothetical protein
MTDGWTRRSVLVRATGIAGLAGLVGGASTYALPSDSERAAASFEAADEFGPDCADRPGRASRLTFTQGGALRTLARDGGSVQSWPGRSGVAAVGPAAADFEDGGEVVALTSATTIAVGEEPDGDGESVDIEDAPAATQKTTLAVARWGDDDPAVFYAGSGGTTIYRASPDEDPTAVATSGNGVGAVAGAADLDGDDEAELAFVDGSQTLRYVDADGTTHSTGVTLGSNNGVGVGTPADFGCTGAAAVPVVDGSNRLLLADADGVDRALITGSDDEQAAKAPVAAVDVDGDGALEVAYLENNNSPAELRYVDDVANAGPFETVRTAAGDRVTADPARGVR